MCIVCFVLALPDRLLLVPCLMYIFFPFQLLCGQAVVTGFAWMAQLKRCSRSQSREPEPRPTPTLGTAPTPLPLLLRRAVKRAGCTSTIPPERWVVNVCPGAADCSLRSVLPDVCLITKSWFEEKGVHVRGIWFEDTIWSKTACLCFCIP